MWGEALLSSYFIINRIPVKDSGKIPYEFWKGKAPNLNFFKVWGCLAKVNISEPKKKKLGSKTIDTVFIGYAQNSNAYRFLMIKSDISNINFNLILEARDASFFEDIFPFKTRISRFLECKPSSSRSIDLELKTKIELRKSKKIRIKKIFEEELFTYLVEGDPCTYDEAMSSSDSSYWKKAINSEIQILENKTWILSDLSPENKAIETK